MSDEEVVVRAFWLDYWKKRKMMKGSQFRTERTVNAGSLLVLLSFLLFA